MSERNEKSLLDQLARLTGQVAGTTLDVARNTATLTAMFGDGWLRSALLKNFEPERLEAMAEAGHFLRDARQTAGLSIREMAEALNLKDDELLRDIESGERVMPLELVFRSASLIARHDPIPYLIKFMRTYNPSMGATLEQWGIMALPVQYERERRWLNLYRQHDVLRSLSDEEYDRLTSYVDSATNLVLDVMQREKSANSVPEPPPDDTPEPEPAPRKKPRVQVEAVKSGAKSGTRKKSTRTKSAAAQGKKPGGNKGGDD